MDPNSEDDERFVRSFNRRRLLAKSALGALVGILIWHHFYPDQAPTAAAGSAAAYVLILGLYIGVNWFFCKCPGCNRFIGIAGVFGGMPRRAPCGSETRNIDRLNWPDA